MRAFLHAPSESGRPLHLWPCTAPWVAIESPACDDFHKQTRSLEPRAAVGYCRRPGLQGGWLPMQIFHRSSNSIAKVSIFGGVFFLGFLGWAVYTLMGTSGYLTGQYVVKRQPVPL